MVKRFQNKISGSRFLLATVAFITVVLWLSAGMLNVSTLPFLALTAITAYFLVELDTRNSIIRIYSRMIPSSFLVLTTMTGAFIHDTYACTALLWTLFLIFLFSAYQDRNAAGKTFYAFLLLGLSSLLFVQTFFFLPVIWFTMLTNLMSMGRRTLAASIVGMLMPYWFIFGCLMFKGDLTFFEQHFSQLVMFQPLSPWDVSDTSNTVTFGTLFLLSLVGMIHFMRTSNKDKIRTRMFMEMIITTNLFVILFTFLQPVHFMHLLPILVITTSVLISHYIVLTDTKLTNRSVYLIIAIVSAATIYNLWIS